MTKRSVEQKRKSGSRLRLLQSLISNQGAQAPSWVEESFQKVGCKNMNLFACLTQDIKAYLEWITHLKIKL